MPMQMIRLYVLVFRENEHWIAQCLNYDLAAQATTVDELMYEFGRTLAGTCVVRAENNLPGLESLPPAPKFYWDVYRQAALRVEADPAPRFQAPTSMPPAYMIPQIEMRMSERIH